MSKMGNNNTNINGNNNTINNTVNHYKQASKKKKLEPFSETVLQENPFLKLLYLYAVIVIFLGLNFLRFKYGFAFEILVAVFLVAMFGLYSLYGKLQAIFFDMVHIKEDAIIKGQKILSYGLIRPDDISINEGRIKLGLVDNPVPIILNLQDDAAGLLKYKIEEYHRYYNLSER